MATTHRTRPISCALGARGVLLAKHSLARVGDGIEDACWMTLSSVRQKNQLRARDIGKLSAIDPDYARDARDHLTDPSMIAMQYAYAARAARTSALSRLMAWGDPMAGTVLASHGARRRR